ncbi:MAG: invasion associated locus B family protein [Pseudomonadota bacterium]
MTNVNWESKAVALGAAMAVATGLMAAPALAQDKKKPAADAQAKWVKLCSDIPVIARGKDGKPIVGEDGKPKREGKTMCLTQHEAIDGRTGIPLVTAALREVDGEDKKTFLVGMPLGMNIPTGIRIAFHSKSEWDKISKDGKFADPKSVKWTKLSFVHCLETNCIAETQATPELVKSLEAGAVMTAAAVNFEGGPVALPVPLTGFKAAKDGKAIDMKQYAQARGQMMQKIRERQKAAIEAFKKTAAEKAKEDAAKKQ